MITKLKSSLHPLEIELLPYLKHQGSLSQLISDSNLKNIEIMRALQWLENKKVLTLSEKISEIISLGENGKNYLNIGLPERRFLNILTDEFIDVDKIIDKSKIDKQELSICLGILRKKAAINIVKEKSLKIVITESGKKLRSKPFMEEKFISKLPLDFITLIPEDKFAFDNLIKRKDIIILKRTKEKLYSLTELGIKLTNEKINRDDFIEKLTPELIQTSNWRGKTFRTYDVNSAVPKLYPGRLHHYRMFLDSVQKKFLSMGFEEMSGPIVESEFWDMDALFMPQFHSARDIHEAYYIKNPKTLDIDPNLIDKVKKAHEQGIDNSRGWRYSFDVDRTRKAILRTQTTACSARKLASLDLKIPGKYFSISKCFRYDVIDATHLPDFSQAEGIVLSEKMNFRSLKGLLKIFAEEFAQTDKIKIKPAYFPFTEPSAELFAKHPDLGWVELGGSGIFRPEVTKSLGIDVPVIAWGLGIDRIGMFNMGINHIKDLMSTDLDFLRNVRIK